MYICTLETMSQAKSNKGGNLGHYSANGRAAIHCKIAKQHVAYLCHPNPQPLNTGGCQPADKVSLCRGACEGRACYWTANTSLTRSQCRIRVYRRGNASCSRLEV